MSATGRYQLKSILAGFLLVPVLASVVTLVIHIWVLSGLDAGPVVDRFVVPAGIAFTVAGLVAFGWARHRERPNDWTRALLPVLAVPACFVAVWLATFLVTGRHSDALTVAGFADAPWLVVTILATLYGEPTVLVAALLGSLGGFVIGARRRPPTGRRGLAVLVAASLVLAGATAGVVGAREWRTFRWEQTPQVSDEVDLWQYQPFVPGAGERLVRLDHTPSLQLTEGFPRLDGATALYPLYAAAAQATYALPASWDDERVQRFSDEHVACTRTSEAYERLAAGAVDGIFVLQPSAEQLQRIEATGGELDLLPIARDAFVFFVNQDNPVDGLTSDQIRAIYTRQITNWKQVGGRDEEILAFQRPEGSGSQTAMLAEVMGDTPMTGPMEEEVQAMMGGVINQVAGYRNLAGALGYSFRWYATEMNGNPGIKLLAVDGVAPTPEHIADGSYPFTVDLNLATTRAMPDSLAALAEWLLSAEGQDLVAKVGYVPVR
mgnify:CR=1 FL=1